VTNQTDLHEVRAIYSRTRLRELQNRLVRLAELESLPGLTIFAPGSYGRLEASEHSDLDLFFFLDGDGKNMPEPRTSELRMFGQVINTALDMNFPKFSNDCEYLVIQKTADVLSHLGSRLDDHANYFTARMLFLLESRCLYGKEAFDAITQQIVSSYFKDFPDHSKTFQPIFLINDICRFWKTMLLNYENKRNFKPKAEEAEYPAKKVKQKVRNFKLKYSRMTTCFASIAAFGSLNTPVSEDQVVEVTRLTPRERLLSVAERVPSAGELVSSILERYSWFLEMTGKPTVELEAHFVDKNDLNDMFIRANDYGDLMFKLLQHLDQAGRQERLLRTLVI